MNLFEILLLLLLVGVMDNMKIIISFEMFLLISLLVPQSLN